METMEPEPETTVVEATNEVVEEMEYDEVLKRVTKVYFFALCFLDL